MITQELGSAARLAEGIAHVKTHHCSELTETVALCTDCGKHSLSLFLHHLDIVHQLL